MMSTWRHDIPRTCHHFCNQTDAKREDKRQEEEKGERAVAEVEALGAFHYGNALAFMQHFSRSADHSSHIWGFRDTVTECLIICTLATLPVSHPHLRLISNHQLTYSMSLDCRRKEIPRQNPHRPRDETLQRKITRKNSLIHVWTSVFHEFLFIHMHQCQHIAASDINELQAMALCNTQHSAILLESFNF